MKLLVAVKSCQADLDKGCHDVIRTTWGKDFRGLADVRFFVGAEFKKYQSDEIHLNCRDDYNSLPWKTRAICQWAVGKAIDYLFLCDVDTFLLPRKLLTCGFENYDYAGKIDRLGETFPYEATNRDGVREFYPRCYSWASGGYGYFLSRKAFTVIADTLPKGWAEDLWVGQVLGEQYSLGEITALNTPRNVYSWHHPEHGEIYDIKKLADWMNKMHKEQQ